MISMKEIGKICGVGESTVSKALNGRAGIKHATRERIQAVARKYGYQPNAMVEYVQTGKSRSIGIACNEFRCQFSGAIMNGIHEALHKHGYDSYVISWDKLVRDEADMLSRFARRRVDGLLLLPMAMPPSSTYVSQLYSFHNPIVLVDQYWGVSEFDFIGTSNREAMAQVTEYLIKCGYKRIGAVNYSGVSSGQERKAGFLDAMISNHLSINPRHLCEIRDCDADNTDILKKFLDIPDRPEALVCFNDYLAVDTMNAAFDLGIKVPEELAVTGFGNLPICKKIRPQLTTIDQHAEEIGEQAAVLLIDRITGREEGPRQEVLVPAALRIRNSTRDLSKNNATRRQGK